MQVSEPASHSEPDGPIVELPEWQALYSFQEEPVPVTLGFNDRPVTRRGPEVVLGQNRRVDVDLPLRVMQEAGLRVSSGGVQRCPPEVLEDEVQQRPIALPDIELFEGEARAIRMWSTREDFDLS